MTREEIYKKAQEIFVKALMIDEDDFTMETDIINDLCPSSLQIVGLTIELENAFDIAITDGEMKEIFLVSELVEFVEEKIRYS